MPCRRWHGPEPGLTPAFRFYRLGRLNKLQGPFVLAPRASGHRLPSARAQTIRFCRRAAVGVGASRASRRHVHWRRSMRNQAIKQGAVPATAAPTNIPAREDRSDQYTRLIALQNENVNALVRLHTIFRDGAAEWSSDLLEFASRHFQRQSNGASWQANGANPLETVVSHLRYCQEFAEECLDQTAKVLKLAAKVSRDSRAHLENHAATMLSHLGHDGSFASRESTAYSAAVPDQGGGRP